MPPQKIRRSKRRKSKTYPSGTVRRRKSSTAGKILPPLDVRSNKQLKEFERRIKQGGLTIVLVWAPWCHHCHKMMPHFDAAAKSPNRSIQAIKVEDTMLPAVNQVLISNINRSAKPLNVEGYPSIIVLDNKGNKVTDIEPIKDTSVMKQVMDNAGPLATEAGIDIEQSIKRLNTPVITGNKLPSIQPSTIEQAPIRMPSIKPSVKPSVKPLSAAIMPSSTIIPSTRASPVNKKVFEEADNIISLSAPLTSPPTATDDIESISNSLTPEQKIGGGGGGGRRGGSLYSALLRTTYTLAPATALLATAAIVMKKTKRTKRTNRKLRKTRKTRK